MKTLPITAAQFIRQFERYLGIGEHPPGSNKNEITRWAGVFSAWCMFNISRVLWDLGILTITLGRKMGYTVDLYLWGKKMGLLVDPRGKYHMADLVLFNFGDPHYGGRPLGIHHVGACIVDLGRSKVSCIEGNTGDDCRKRVRNKSQVAAVVRLPWKVPFFAPKSKGRFARLRRDELCYNDEGMRHKTKRLFSSKDLWVLHGGEVRVHLYRGGKAQISGGFSAGRKVWVSGSSLGKAYVR